MMLKQRLAEENNWTPAYLFKHDQGLLSFPHFDSHDIIITIFGPDYYFTATSMSVRYLTLTSDARQPNGCQLQYMMIF